jgi:putative endonuclease
MLDYCVYVLYSKKINHFYIGVSSNVEKRLLQHNSSFYKKAYTTQSNDWEVYYKSICLKKELAMKIERHIKKMRNRSYLENLKVYPLIFERLVEKYTE